jgi:aminoglycoside phosphotransferase (APT) family kinase protein
VDTRGLREGGAPWLLTFADGSTAVLRHGYGFATELAALRVAQAHGVPVPRLLASGDGVMLVSVVTGTSRIPVTATPRRLAAFGAAGALLHAIPLPPTADLPLRHRPLELWDFVQWRANKGTTDLLRTAERTLAALPEPTAEPVLVHGDLWQGNTMWHDDELTAIIDWDAAGVGHPGIDLGGMRCDAALMFGIDAADPVLAGWADAMGRPAVDPADLAYWDLVAALSTPPDLAEWEAVIQDQGRPDLTGPLLTARRDEFLLAALDRVHG